MNDQLALRRTARTCLSALADTEPAPTLYSPILRALDRLHVGECDATSVPTPKRSTSWIRSSRSRARTWCWHLVAFGIPWAGLHPLLRDLTIALQTARAHSPIRGEGVRATSLATWVVSWGGRGWRRASTSSSQA